MDAKAERERVICLLARELDCAIFEYNRALLNLVQQGQELQMWLRKSRLLENNDEKWIEFGKYEKENKDDNMEKENYYESSDTDESDEEVLSPSLDDSGRIYRRSQSDLIYSEAGLIFSTSFLNKEGSSSSSVGASKSINDSFKNLWINSD